MACSSTQWYSCGDCAYVIRQSWLELKMGGVQTFWDAILSLFDYPVYRYGGDNYQAASLTSKTFVESSRAWAVVCVQ